jgi:DNA gyrase subunit A
MKDLRVLGRVTQGVRLINIGDKDEIASVAKINYIPGDEEELDENGNPIVTVELDENGNPIAVIPPSEGSELLNTIIDRAMDDAVINPISSDDQLEKEEDELAKEEEDLGDDVPPVE